MMLEKTMPVLKSTLSRFRNLSAACLAVSNLLVVGDQDWPGRPPSLPFRDFIMVETVADIGAGRHRGRKASRRSRRGLLGCVNGASQQQGGSKGSQAKRHPRISGDGESGISRGTSR